MKELRVGDSAMPRTVREAFDDAVPGHRTVVSAADRET